MGRGKNSTVQSQNDAPEEGDLWTPWQLFPPDDDQHLLLRKKSGSRMFRWLVMGGDCVGEETCSYPRVWVRRWSNLSPKKGWKLHVPLASYGRRLHVHISAWEFDVNIRSTILNGRQWNSAVHSSLSRRYPVCAFSAIV